MKWLVSSGVTPLEATLTIIQKLMCMVSHVITLIYIMVRVIIQIATKIYHNDRGTEMEF